MYYLIYLNIVIGFHILRWAPLWFCHRLLLVLGGVFRVRFFFHKAFVNKTLNYFSL